MDFLPEHAGTLVQLLSWLAVVCLAGAVAQIATVGVARVAAVATLDSRRTRLANQRPADAAPRREADRLVTTWLARCLRRHEYDAPTPPGKTAHTNTRPIGLDLS